MSTEFNFKRFNKLASLREVQNEFNEFNYEHDQEFAISNSLNEKNLSRDSLIERVVRKIFQKNSEIDSLKVSRPVFSGEVDVVIPLYGSSPSIENCLLALERSRSIAINVILVSNGAPAQVVNRCRKHQIVKKIIVNETNLGFGQGCNQGIEASNSEFIVLLNSDALVEPDTLAFLIDDLILDSSVAVAGAVPISSSRVLEFGRYFKRDAHTFAYGADASLDDPRVAYVRQVPYVSFVCVAVRKSAYYEANGFDSQFFPAYYEDSDLSITLFNKGHRVLADFRAKVTHVGGESSSVLENIETIKEENRLKFSKKHRKMLEEIPLDVDQTLFPHEAELLMNMIYSRTRLIIQGRYSPSKLKRRNIILGHGDTLLCKKIKLNQLNHLRKIGCQVSVNFDRAMHYWFRDRIGLFDEIILEHRFKEKLHFLLSKTQPEADYYDLGKRQIYR